MVVENIASSVILTSDPPREVSVNQIFAIDTYVTVSGGYPLSNAVVVCNVTKALDMSQVSSNIFTSLANSNYNIQKSSMLAPGSKLDPSRTSAVTDKYGRAKLFLRVIESPLDSSVRVVCQSGNAMSSPSPKIKVTHPVRKITQSQNYTEHVEVIFNKNVDGYLRTKVPLKTPVKLDLWEEENAEVSIIRAEDITVHVVKYSDVERIREANVNLTDVYGVAQNLTERKYILDELYELGHTLMRGVQTVSAIKEQYSNRYPVTFDRPVINGTEVLISNITMIVDEPGKYSLMFGANGVYTNLQTEEFAIEVEDDVTFLKRTFDWAEKGILTAFYFLTLILASKMVKGYWLPLGLLFTGFYAYMVTYKSHVSSLYFISVFIFAGIISLYLIWSFIIFIVDACIKKKRVSYFFEKKKQYYMEYVYQKLNGHPSNFWMDKQRKTGLVLNGLYNTDPPQHHSHKERRQSEFEKDFKIDEEAKVPENHDMTNSYGINCTMSEASIVESTEKILDDKLLEEERSGKLPKDELKRIPVDIQPWEELGFFKKMIRIFTPFEIMYRKNWVNDCFVYPQALLTCVIICFFSMTYLGIETFKFIFNFTGFIDDSYDQVHTSVFAFLRNGLDRYFNQFKIDPTTNDLDVYFSRLNTVETTLNELIFAIKLGAIIGACISVIAVMMNLLLILYDYKRRVLDARKGIFNFKRDKISLQVSAGLPGAVISNAIFVFFVVILVLTIVFTLLAWPLTWKVLWRLKWNLISILTGTIINAILKVIMNKLCYENEYVKRRGLLSIFDFFLLQMAILAGIVAAISRFGILCGILFVSVMRIDVNSMPEWITQFMYLDNFNKSYYGSILVQHCQNNPVMITFYELMFLVTKPVNSDKNLEEEEKLKANRRKMIRNRFHLWAFLTKNPNLAQFRKHNLPKEDESEGSEEPSGDLEESKDASSEDIEDSFIESNTPNDLRSSGLEESLLERQSKSLSINH
jgi:hypothetical protein